MSAVTTAPVPPATASSAAACTDPRDAVFAALQDLAERDPSVFVLTNDMGALGLERLRAAFPDRVVNAGIAEQNLVSVAAGLALAGKTVFTFGILSHMTARCYEQLRLDVCALGVPVIGIASGSGLSYGTDGPTHHGIYDLALLRGLPGMAIYNPADAVTAHVAVRLAHAARGPALIRIDKEAPAPLYDADRQSFANGAIELRGGGDVTLFSTGCSVHRALAAADLLSSDGIAATVVDVFRLKPVEVDLIRAWLQRAPLALSVEEHCASGGLGSLIAEIAAEMGGAPSFRALSLGDAVYFGATSRAWAEKHCHIGPEGIAAAVRERLGRAGLATRPAAVERDGGSARERDRERAAGGARWRVA